MWFPRTTSFPRCEVESGGGAAAAPLRPSHALNSLLRLGDDEERHLRVLEPQNSAHCPRYTPGVSARNQSDRV